MVKISKKKELKEIVLVGKANTLEIVSTHRFGISIISLTPEDAIDLRAEIDEWLAHQKQKIALE